MKYLKFEINVQRCVLLLQNDVEAAREAYNSFLSNYPYCYGYWRKYADYEKRKGNKDKCEEVTITPLTTNAFCVSLLLHFLKTKLHMFIKPSVF